MWAKKTRYIWQNTLAEAIREKQETDDLSQMKRYGIRESEFYGNIYNLFSDLAAEILKDRCSALKDDVNFYIKQQDIVSASVPIRKFRVSMDKLFFFRNYKVLKTEDKSLLTAEIKKNLYPFLNSLKKNFEKSDAADCIFECASCIQKLKFYE